MSAPRDWDLRANELSAEAIGRGDPTAWFDELYAAGRAGEVGMPWDRSVPQVDLRPGPSASGLDGTGAGRVVVGCGLGADAEYLVLARLRHQQLRHLADRGRRWRWAQPRVERGLPVADLLALPGEWHRAFDLVVEIFTPAGDCRTRHARARPTRVIGLVAEGGTLLAVSSGTPTPRTSRVAAVPAGPGVHGVRSAGTGCGSWAWRRPTAPRWRATYRR